MTGQDIFGRDAKFQCVEIDETYPKYLRENQNEYEYLIMPKLSLTQIKLIKIKMKIKRVVRRGKRGIRRVIGRS